MVVVLLLGRNLSTQLDIGRFVSSLANLHSGANLPVVLRTFNGKRLLNTQLISYG